MEKDLNVEQIYDGYDIPHKFRALLGYDKLLRCITKRKEIISIVSKLDSISPECERHNATDMLLNTIDEDDYDLLIIAGHKHTWLNTVRALNIAGYPKNRKALPSLILLLQDLNWPGAKEGMHVLKEAGKDAVIPLIAVAVEAGFSSNDFIWLAWIKEFLEFANIGKSDFNNHDVYDLLEHAEW